MSTFNPKHVIREADLILSGELQQTPEQFNRWVAVQIKKLAKQSAARHLESAQLRNKINGVERHAKGGL